MGFLDNVERSLERAVNGAFARTFRSGVQPVEIGSALKRELDIGAVAMDRDRVLAPNHFVVRVSPQDAERLMKMSGTLQSELHSLVTKHAAHQGYQLLGDVLVELASDDSLTPGVLEVDATQVRGRVHWVAAIDVDGTRHELRNGVTVVGRGADSDIRIGDSAASRKHLEIHWDGKSAFARDLGSTNGSKIEGQRFQDARLEAGTVITIGQTALRFGLVPGQSSAPRQSTQPASRPQSTPSIDQDFWRGL